MTPEVRRAFDQLPERVQRCLRPSLRLRTAPAAVEALRLGQSRVGGVPDLPAGFEWPRHDGLPLSFIAQLDLAGLPSVLPLPKQGSLVFFYDSEQRTWGFDPKDRGSAVVAYIPGPASSLVPTPPPEDVAEAGRFRCCSVELHPDENLPSPRSPHYDPELSEEETDLLYGFLDAAGAGDDSPRHRLGGHADVVQGSMELECQLVTNGLYCGDATGYRDPRAKGLAAGVLDWRLLLQIDTDDGAGMMWGDCGMLYYWIRDEDLRSASFDRSWLILQCS